MRPSLSRILFPARNAETLAWRAAVIVDGGSVSNQRLLIVDKLVFTLKGAAVWSKLDRKWLLAAENSQSALRDIKAAAAATITGTPTFVANAGYTGVDSAGTATYISTGFNPSTAGGNYTQNSAHLSVWVNADFTTVTGGCAVGLQTNAGTQSNIFPRFSDGKAYYRVNDGIASAGITTANAAGFYVSTRSASGAQNGYKNSTDQSVVAQTSGALTNQTFAILANQTTVPTVITNFGGQLSTVSIGGSLTGADVTNMQSALATYRTAVGL